jgi:tetratricopeptide (TPR) repeat protein
MWLERALSIAKQIGHTQMLVISLMNMSITIDQMGNAQEAIQLLDEAINMMANLNDTRLLAGLSYEKAVMLFFHKDWTNSIKFFFDTYNLAIKYGYQDREGQALFGIACANSKLGNKEVALEKAKLSYKILSEIEHGDKDKVARFLVDPEGYPDEELRQIV